MSARVSKSARRRLQQYGVGNPKANEANGKALSNLLQEAGISEEAAQDAPIATQPTASGGTLVPEGKFGSETEKVLRRTVGEEFDVDQYIIDEILGGCRIVNRKTLDKKKEKMRPHLDALFGAVAELLQKYVSENGKTGTAFKSMQTKASVLASWKTWLGMHPHRWPRSELFRYALELRVCLSRINSATLNSLSEKKAEPFVSWQDPKKVLLPSEPVFVFSISDPTTVHKHLCIMYDAANVLFTEVRLPPFGWEVQAKIGSRRLSTRSGGAVTPELADSFVAHCKSNISQIYMRVLGCTDASFDVASAAIGVAGGMNAGEVNRALQAVVNKSSLVSKAYGPKVANELRIVGETTKKALSSGTLKPTDRMRDATDPNHELGAKAISALLPEMQKMANGEKKADSSSSLSPASSSLSPTSSSLSPTSPLSVLGIESAGVDGREKEKEKELE